MASTIEETNTPSGDVRRLDERILQHLHGHGEQMCKEIGDALDESWKTVSEELQKLIAARRVTKRSPPNGYPRYSLCRTYDDLPAAVLKHLRDHGESMCGVVAAGLRVHWDDANDALQQLLLEPARIERVCRRGSYPSYRLPKERTRRPRKQHPPITADDVRPIYFGSDGGATRRLHGALSKRGGHGTLAMLLLRAQKKSDRAKVYQGDWRGAGYDEKDSSLREVCDLLVKDPELVTSWGWGTDQGAFLENVLYIDLPTGQVSFHVPQRHSGPDYPGKWDQSNDSRERILQFAEYVLPDVPPRPATPLRPPPRTPDPPQTGRS